ncbi:hypothetical protein ACSFA2_03735 [Variovorax sp. LT2P21]|uniref:hypothetical protein n=1 Tax=Variovorax sp. LT2P21 TaxID=3443731 RepID=UPI003F4730A4
MGGGGGDNGYEARQQAVEDQKTKARQRLNAAFGEGAPAEVDRNAFTSTIPLMMEFSGATGGDDPVETSNFVQTRNGGTSSFDQAGYDAALAENESILGRKAEREKLYGAVRENAFTAGKRGLDESREKAARDLRFELFAKGLNGGSEDVNQNAMLGRTYDAGVLDLGAKADAAATGLRTSDETTRLNLLQGIDSGMDQGSILSSAANQLSNNSERAAAEAQGTSIGDLFANAGLLSAQSQYRQGKAVGTDWWNTLTPGNSTVRTKASSGSLSAS